MASIFTMEDVNEVVKLKLVEAKSYAFHVIDDSKTARVMTKQKARKVVASAKTSEHLASAMVGWILAHPDEGLKVI